MNVAYNMDCMEALRQMPDNAFDLAVVDPPYGDGCSQAVQVERERENVEPLRSTLRPVQIDHLHSSQRRRERERERGTDKERTSDNLTERGVMRTGGTWAEKYAKKS